MRRLFYPGCIPAFVLIALFSILAANSAAQRPGLELLDAKASATQTTISLVGQVKNISPSEIRGVIVLCDFLGAGNKVVRTEETTLETDPLPPDKTSEFKCDTKASPEIRGYGIPRFNRLFGGPVAVKDGRKK